jgi:heme-degrading monooxygenase HmoA
VTTNERSAPAIPHLESPIVRVWRGQTTGENAAAYLRHVIGHVLPALRAIRGYRGGRVLRRETGDRMEVLVVTEWDSWTAIRAFAGDNPEAAVIEPAAKALLEEFDEVVQHFDVAYDLAGLDS